MDNVWMVAAPCGWDLPSWRPLTFGLLTPFHFIRAGSHLVATVIGSAVVPTMVANALFMPTHLLPKPAARPMTTALADSNQ